MMNLNPQSSAPSEISGSKLNPKQKQIKITPRIRHNIYSFRKNYPELANLKDGQIIYILKRYRDINSDDFKGSSLK